MHVVHCKPLLFASPVELILESCFDCRPCYMWPLGHNSTQRQLFDTLSSKY